MVSPGRGITRASATKSILMLPATTIGFIYFSSGLSPLRGEAALQNLRTVLIDVLPHHRAFFGGVASERLR